MKFDARAVLAELRGEPSPCYSCYSCYSACLK